VTLWLGTPLQRFSPGIRTSDPLHSGLQRLSLRALHRKVPPSAL